MRNTATYRFGRSQSTIISLSFYKEFLTIPDVNTGAKRLIAIHQLTTDGINAVVSGMLSHQKRFNTCGSDNLRGNTIAFHIIAKGRFPYTI